MQILDNHPLSRHTTIHIGGNARKYVEIVNTDELQSILKQAKSENAPVFVLGAGSNTLINDAGFDGYVIHPVMRGMEWLPQNNGEFLVTIGAGADFDEAVRQSCEKNLGGIEALSGIPGSTGGALVQNMGAYGQEMAEVFVSAQAINRNTLETVTLYHKDLAFAYRHTSLKTPDNPWIVASVTIRLYPFDADKANQRCIERGFKKLIDTPPKTALQLRELILETRKSKAMYYDEKDYNTHGVGSFFVNPVVSSELAKQVQTIAVDNHLKPMPQFDDPNGIKLSAAWLIENAGFTKGSIYNDSTGLSEKHCLAIVNRNHASCTDIIRFAQTITNSVYTKFSVKLEPEVVYLSNQGIQPLPV